MKQKTNGANKDVYFLFVVTMEKGIFDAMKRRRTRVYIKMGKYDLGSKSYEKTAFRTIKINQTKATVGRVGRTRPGPKRQLVDRSSRFSQCF